MSNSLNCKSTQRFTAAVEGYMAEPRGGEGRNAQQVTVALNQDWQDAHILPPPAAATAADIRSREILRHFYQLRGGGGARRRGKRDES